MWASLKFDSWSLGITALKSINQSISLNKPYKVTYFVFKSHTFQRGVVLTAVSCVPKADDIKPCPRCAAYIIKMNDGSCNHMTCAVCGCEFCWLCMKEISDLHYLRSVYWRPLQRSQYKAKWHKSCIIDTVWEQMKVKDGRIFYITRFIFSVSFTVLQDARSGVRSPGAGRRKSCGSWGHLWALQLALHLLLALLYLQWSLGFLCMWVERWVTTPNNLWMLWMKSKV